jgi:hypothetical protein
MKILLDQGAPAPLVQFFREHEVRTAFQQGWAKLSNGELLRSAEDAGFGLMITTDQNLRYQQNLAERKITIVVLLTTSWPRIRKRVALIQAAIEKSVPGEYLEISFP